MDRWIDEIDSQKARRGWVTGHLDTDNRQQTDNWTYRTGLGRPIRYTRQIFFSMADILLLYAPQYTRQIFSFSMADILLLYAPQFAAYEDNHS